MHYEIINHYLNKVFYCIETQLKKKLENCFLGARVAAPNWYTGLPNGLDTSL